ncbi:hypothetical protein [Paraburkholderia sp.]|uniref:hypothetical protein n=1 Tax=Paraburkholderia sp. TaxID=1926495 RepID=UPI0025E66E53|nr:hypothetical protein [Paraburkholderia sp.]
MSTYFHLCSVQLASGSIIEPGNWGRIIGLYPQDMNPAKETLINEPAAGDPAHTARDF